MRRRQRRLRGNLPAPEGLAGRGAAAALRGLTVLPLRPAPRALHPLPLPANAAHAEYSDRLLVAPSAAGRIGPVHKVTFTIKSTRKLSNFSGERRSIASGWWVYWPVRDPS